MRTEKDKTGEVHLEDGTLYGIQTARAAENFTLGCRKTRMPLIYAIVTVKKAAALAGKAFMKPLKRPATRYCREKPATHLSPTRCRAAPAHQPI